MMKVADGYKLKQMNTAEIFFIKNSLAHPLVLILCPLVLSVHAVRRTVDVFNTLGKHPADLMCTFFDATEESWL